MSSGFKLLYLNSRGRAEVIRYIFKLADQNFIDNRIPYPEWPVIKPTVPGGQVPVLEHKGVQLTQAASIARYLAREFNLDGTTSLEKATCDILMEMSNEVIDLTAPIFFYCENEEQRKPLKDKLRAHLKEFEAAAARYRKPGCKFILGDEPSMADAAILGPSDTVKRLAPDCYPGANHPTLLEIMENFSKVPNIAKWIAQRPSQLEVTNQFGLTLDAEP